jgi:UDP-N-acetylmuramoyl-L-alanine---L-glutamate ligase
MMIDLLKPMLASGKLLILGFGREGQSTFKYIRKHFPGIHVAIADRDADLKEKAGGLLKGDGIKLFLGDNYLNVIENYGLVIKSPGVGLPREIKTAAGGIITSQTKLMLGAYHRQIIGITGTKGKSTTTSLVHHLLLASGMKSVLVGNIGRPPFDYLDQIDSETIIAYEMSSHQLEDTSLAPHISVLLNLYPEHLDRYPSPEAYFSTKMNILYGQIDGDTFIYNEDIPGISGRIKKAGSARNYLSFSAGLRVNDGCFLSGDSIMLIHQNIEFELIKVTDDFPLKGNHNRMNMMAALLAALAAGADQKSICEGLRTFKGLEHRLEYVGEYQGISFYNDSIATIPEAAVAAVKALPLTDTLLLGGFDRMLDYSAMTEFMMNSQVRNFIFSGKAGERMFKGFVAANTGAKQLIMAESFQEAMAEAVRVTEKGKICLLSPAAASYDQFRNFEERGHLFKKLARGE